MATRAIPLSAIAATTSSFSRQEPQDNSYKETKYKSLIPIPFYREEIECKPQRPIRIPCEEFDYKIQFIHACSKNNSRKRQSNITTRYRETKSQPFTRICCEKKSHKTHRDHHEHEKSSTDVRASKVYASDIGIHAENLDTVTKRTGTGIQQIVYINTNKSTKVPSSITNRTSRSTASVKARTACLTSASVTSVIVSTAVARSQAPSTFHRAGPLGQCHHTLRFCPHVVLQH